MVPEALVMRQVAHRIEHARESVRRQGIDPERMPWDYEKLIAELKPGAEKAACAARSCWRPSPTRKPSRPPTPTSTPRSRRSRRQVSGPHRPSVV
jgi:hypothetical protein